jgi:predicted secreted hydrolase
VPGRAIEFPRDRGSHPGHRIEWWYVTGQVHPKGDPSRRLGFQVTFFRVRNPDAESNPSRFAPRQILFAHAALADAGTKRFRHAQRSARMLEGLVEASEAETDVRLDDWSLARGSAGYRTRVKGEGFELELALAPTQPPMLQGDRGFSRKGPAARHASYYYSEPQLRVEGRVASGEEALEVEGTAWLDHEWSSELLASEATGWDWLGANLAGGGALMAFRIRSKDGATVWASATLRPRDGPTATLPPEALSFTPIRRWRSPRSGVDYPVSMEVRVGARRWRLEPLLDDQELDARASTGTLYWEGAVSLVADDGTRGEGYLELTGYGERVPF